MKSLEEKINEKIYQYETSHIVFELVMKILTFIVVGFISYLSISLLFDQLNSFGTFELFSNFTVNVEVFNKYFFTTWIIIFQEMPKSLLILISTSLLILGFLILTFIINFGKIKNKLKAITKHYFFN